MHVVVFGAGAVGTLFAARLTHARHQVTLVARPESVLQITAQGLTVEGTRPCHVPGVAVGTVPTDRPVDALLLGVKAYDVRGACADIARRRPHPVPLLLPQNGLGIEERAVDGLTTGGWADPSPWVVRAIHSIPATLLGAGRVRQAGDGEILLPAESVPPTPAVETWASLLSGLGYPVRRTTVLAREVWRKALVNAAINPVTADHGIPNGWLQRDPYRGQALQLLSEARAVAEAEGHAFREEELESDLWRVVRATAANRSSMLQDVERGRRTEVEEISGEILSRGRAHGLDLPATRRAVERLRRRSPAPAPSADANSGATQPS